MYPVSTEINGYSNIQQTYLINVFLGGLGSLFSSILASLFNGSTLINIDLVLFIIALSSFIAFRFYKSK